jgi:hypothetical protein
VGAVNIPKWNFFVHPLHALASLVKTDKERKSEREIRVPNIELRHLKGFRLFAAYLHYCTVTL